MVVVRNLPGGLIPDPTRSQRCYQLADGAESSRADGDLAGQALPHGQHDGTSDIGRVNEIVPTQRCTQHQVLPRFGCDRLGNKRRATAVRIEHVVRPYPRDLAALDGRLKESAKAHLACRVCV